MVRTYYFIRIFDYITRVIRFFVPWVARAFMFFVVLIATSVLTFWSGVPRRVDQIANEWLDRAVLAGFPTEWDSHLYHVLWALGLLMVIVGWVILSFITVWIVHLIF